MTNRDSLDLSGSTMVLCADTIHAADYRWDTTDHEFVVTVNHDEVEHIALAFQGGKPVCEDHAAALAKSLTNTQPLIFRAADLNVAVEVIAAYAACYHLSMASDAPTLAFELEYGQAITVLDLCPDARSVWAWWAATGSTSTDQWESYPSPETAAAWAATAFSHDDARRWCAVGVTDPVEAARFVDAGVTPNSLKQLHTDDKVGFVRVCLDAGVPYEQAKQWCAVGFADPHEVLAWRSRGVLSSKAAVRLRSRLGLHATESLLASSPVS